MQREARCCCGKMTIRVEGEPQLQGICHCNDCKRRTGSAFGWSAYFDDDQVMDQRGERLVYHVERRGPQERFFCTSCGSTLFWKTAYFDGMTGIAGGCFVEHPLAEPGLTLSNEGQCAWLSLPEEWKTSL